ncbi:MAG TPA: mechanosensitive ion channel family protein [Candidatus Binatia bacterium]|nr:mechanosensitive ion channel family protein [Candidatus Binatia bacterium]
MNQKPRKRAIMLGDYTNNPRSQSEFFHRARAALWRFFPRVWWHHGFRVIAAVLVIGGCACGAIAGEATQPAAEPSKVAAPKEAELVVWNQPITVFRASFAGLTPEERAAQAAERIQDLPLGSESAEIKFEPAKIGAAEGVAFSVNSRPLFFLTAGDLAPDSKQPLNAEAQTVVTALRAALQARVDQRQWSTLLMSAARVLIATLLLLGLLWVWRRVRIGLLKAVLPEKYLLVFAVDLRMHILEGGRAAIRLISAVVVLLLGYWWFVYSLEQFPYTASLGEKLEAFLVQLFLEFGRGALAAIPGLIAVVIIVLIARWGARLINTVFQEVEKGRLSFPWLERETSRTTRTLLIAVVWLFALVVAYPYIPGSDTDAFKGLSVLIGLMITLGSTGLINQIISGLFVIYSKSVKAGDYVRIGDIEGEVINVGSLATKLRTPRQEEITMPHSVLVGTATTNYSRLAGKDGMVITVSVTIGYDVPWRQVHALLLLGASRTPGIRQEPSPRVLQRELSDFYVQYHLLAHLEEGESRAAVLSELHAQIQDAFNEHGTQIMSPHFESQPEKPVFVPKSGWYTPPASQPASEVAVEPREIESREIEPREHVSAEPLATPASISKGERKDRKRPIPTRSSRAKPPII